MPLPAATTAADMPDATAATATPTTTTAALAAGGILRGSCTVLASPGTCHALCAWVDFDYCPVGGEAALVQTGPAQLNSSPVSSRPAGDPTLAQMEPTDADAADFGEGGEGCRSSWAFGPTAWWQAVVFLESPLHVHGEPNPAQSGEVGAAREPQGQLVDISLTLELLRGGRLRGSASRSVSSQGGSGCSRVPE